MELLDLEDMKGRNPILAENLKLRSKSLAKETSAAMSPK